MKEVSAIVSVFLGSLGGLLFGFLTDPGLAGDRGVIALGGFALLVAGYMLAVRAPFSREGS